MDATKHTAAEVIKQLPSLEELYRLVEIAEAERDALLVLIRARRAARTEQERRAALSARREGQR